MMRSKKFIKSIIVLGDSEVGKTTLLYNYTKNKQLTTPYKETIVADYFYKEVNFGEEVYLLNFWDTNGQERNSKGLPNNLYKNCNAVILICSYDNRGSFDNLTKWLDFIKVHTANKNIPIILLVNKSDLPKEKLTIKTEELKEYAEKKLLTTIEVSARYYKSVEQGMNKLMAIFSGEILNTPTLYGYRRPSTGGKIILPDPKDQNNDDTVPFPKQRPAPNKKKCC